MDINKFAPNLSFFFSNGLDPEYGDRSGRTPHLGGRHARHVRGRRAQSRSSSTTFRRADATFTHKRSTSTTSEPPCRPCWRFKTTPTPSTNAYDEAITTPTEESVRRALAIRLIVNKESGWTKTENPMQGAYIVDELTDLVEEAVLQEFEAISRRGGVLGAMETMYQRGKIQDESMYYEHLKHDGTAPIIGVNTFQNPNAAAFDESAADDFEMELARATPEEKEACWSRSPPPNGGSEATQAALAQTAEKWHAKAGTCSRNDGDREGGLTRSDHRCAVQRRWAVSAQHVTLRRNVCCRWI